MRENIQQMYLGHQKKFRFLLAGIVNTAVGLATYPILYLILQPNGLGYVEILIVAQVICITFSFMTNKYFVFKSKGYLADEYIKFFSFHALYFLINMIALPVLVEWIKLNPMIAQSIFSIFIIVTSYFWHNSVTFKDPSGGCNNDGLS
jgi:putative flippase GtrA